MINRLVTSSLLSWKHTSRGNVITTGSILGDGSSRSVLIVDVGSEGILQDKHKVEFDWLVLKDLGLYPRSQMQK